jgi:hypothetical protein
MRELLLDVRTGIKQIDDYRIDRLVSRIDTILAIGPARGE